MKIADANLAKMARTARAAGFRAYMRDPYDSWFYYTDGTRIGYAQFNRSGPSLSTVHYPSSSNGTGFAMGYGCDERAFKNAAGCAVPHWALGAVVSKFANFDTFRRGYWCPLVEVDTDEP